MALVGKDQLVHEVAEISGLEIGEARRALDEMLGAIETQLANGNEVRLTGFGKFSVSHRKAREGRNPQTGESMTIAAKKVPRFSAGAELKKAVPQATQEGASKPRSKPAAEPKREGAPKRASSESSGKETQDHGESAGKSAGGKAVSAATSGAKYALVTAAGLTGGVAVGLAVTHKRKGHGGAAAIDLDKVMAVAQRVGSFGDELSRVASVVKASTDPNE